MGYYLPLIYREETPFFESDDMKPNEGGLQPQYEMSQSEVGKKLFLKQQTIAKVEKSAIESLKQAFRSRNIDPKDLLP